MIPCVHAFMAVVLSLFIALSSAHFSFVQSWEVWRSFVLPFFVGNCMIVLARASSLMRCCSPTAEVAFLVHFVLLLLVYAFNWIEQEELYT
jgi:putative Mn2+ efflux pump MntP